MGFVLKCMAVWAAGYTALVPTLGGIILWDWPNYWPGEWGALTRLVLVVTTAAVGGQALAVELACREKQK